MVVECYAAESAVTMVAGLIDKGYEDYAVEAAISKVFATEALWRTLDEALQTAGGGGYMRELPYERAMRDARINRIFEGTNDILRLFIALTAINDVGQQLKEVAKSLGKVLIDPIKGFGVISDYAVKRVGHATGLGKATFSQTPAQIKEETAVFEESTQNLAKMVDRLLRKHGKEIVGKQFATRRLADSMIDLFVLACALSRVSAEIQSKGEKGTAEERSILKVLAGQVGRRVRSNFGKIDDNDDDQIMLLADLAIEAECYRWDIL
jgi:alkylation response protein AidB-like acyl-CoA dehydrogenase